MTTRPLQQQHFDAVAPRYQRLRTTDDDPVLYIHSALPDRPVTGLDVGAGTGRYTARLQKVVPPGSTVIASDLNAPMLHMLVRNREPAEAPAVRCAGEQLPIADDALDFVTTFNAIHHCDLAAFVAESARVLPDGGQLFVYTRTPEQNAASIWGRSFPGFAARETRLYTASQLRRALAEIGEVTITEFTYRRRATRSRLIEQVHGHHYSTFSLYTPDELEDALQRFLAALGDPDAVSWDDRNTLAHVIRKA